MANQVFPVLPGKRRGSDGYPIDFETVVVDPPEPPPLEPEIDTMPIGTVVPYAGETAPSNWLMADGSTVSKTTYGALFAIIGYTYGGSDDDMVLPDLRGRLPLGVGSGPGLTARARADSGGQEAITDVPQHNHGVAIPGFDDDPETTLVNGAVGVTNGNNYSTSSDVTMVSFNSANAGSASVNVMNPFTALNYIIRYQND